MLCCHFNIKKKRKKKMKRKLKRWRGHVLRWDPIGCFAHLIRRGRPTFLLQLETSICPLKAKWTFAVLFFANLTCQSVQLTSPSDTCPFFFFFFLLDSLIVSGHLFKFLFSLKIKNKTLVHKISIYLFIFKRLIKICNEIKNNYVITFQMFFF